VQSFTVDDDLVALIWERAKPKPFEPMTFSDALRRVLDVHDGKPSQAPMPSAERLPSRDELLEELMGASSDGGRQRAPKADLRVLVKQGVLTEGQELFLLDYQGNRVPNGKATVSGSGLKYKGKAYSMSPLATRLLQEAGFKSTSNSGARHWARADGTSVWHLWLEILKNRD